MTSCATTAVISLVSDAMDSGSSACFSKMVSPEARSTIKTDLAFTTGGARSVAFSVSAPDVYSL